MRKTKGGVEELKLEKASQRGGTTAAKLRSARLEEHKLVEGHRQEKAHEALPVSETLGKKKGWSWTRHDWGGGKSLSREGEGQTLNDRQKKRCVRAKSISAQRFHTGSGRKKE